MSEQLSNIAQAVKALRTQLTKGEIFAGLPNKIGDLMESIDVEPKQPVIVTSDDLEALSRIREIEKRVKHSPHPQVTDDEISFLVDHLASLSPAVRDKGVFFLMSDLLQMNAFTDQQFHWLFDRLQAPDVLFAHILEPENDAIFLRSFALMILSGVVYADQARYNVLTDDDFDRIALTLATYIVMERDGRGYVDGKGWAHAYTHMGNLLEELSQVNSLPRATKVFLQMVTIEGWRRIETPLIYGEDQRIASYLSGLTQVNPFYVEALLVSLKNWQQSLLQLRPRESIRFWNRWYNRGRLLQAMLLQGEMPEQIQEFVQQVIDVY
ncbi:DUF2785 domain-containing protein [Lacticaseibacillus saniviri]|uniref:DUF2785 domain-containing protein n=1 Tax=Lacticaseibacillus saniviri TaxID=931533 RepID=UPI001EDEA28A|nr:DUF2785 domain-containing protein [Lacticaseibacillus saniviri]MCG4280835.1 DUF2785 domain-containing protein [Lacticaseibacillus saniviri]